jgi:hypothetical protein
MSRAKVKEAMVDAGRDPLDILGVIPRLEVGPVRLDGNRVTAPYMVSQNGKTDTMELVYRFEENVFVPDDGDAINLAGMLSAQVALNYGLFCDEIIFHGRFDRDDRRFIKEMATNTAREIFVKKFLEPNPFLLEQVATLPPARRESYLRARLLFPDEPRPKGPTLRKVRSPRCGAIHWHGDPSQHAVLSSGGKDSLLTFGLLKEIGCKIHPVFVNESGRHWFTALNAYRHFADHIPNTARVWTNADRVFNWMLRHLPFVRQDFERVRSDEYPIRLWTVAVFVFGALPLLKKRGIGRLLIGDEFDTTRRLSFCGITHYDGLYDQSRYFDDVLARYFHRKGWGISQFSVIRPLSEILVQKILVERYPEMQRHQVSCHASHNQRNRVLPCGDCEKCRRIVGMLAAIGADPTLCGYSVEQVTRCLKNLPKTGLRQETGGIAHLAFLLKEKGLMPESIIGAVRARQRPEIMKLRFDPQRSPVEGIPVDLRLPLYRIYLEHADGVVKPSGRTWLHCDLFNDTAAQRPYPFELPGNASLDERNPPRYC